MKLLVIVDMQNDFVGGVLGTKEAQAIVKPLADYAKNFDGHVIFTKDTHDENYMNTQEGKKLPVPHCIKGTSGWEVVNELLDIEKRASTIYTMEKPTFGSKELGEYVARNNYDEIEVCGVCTGICVISNVAVMKAFAPETPVTVLTNLCACVNHDTHKTALDAMATFQVDFKEV